MGPRDRDEEDAQHHGLGFVFGPVGWQRENMGRALYDRGGVYESQPPS